MERSGVRPSSAAARAVRFPAQSGEMGRLVQAHDWAATPLGPLEHWPESLRSSVSLVLNSQHPMWIGWGPEATFLYNDAYLQVLGSAKHPWALGKPAAVVWAEIWDVCGPLADKVFREGKASFVDNVRLFMNRGDYIEETFYSFSYSPIFDDRGHVAGLFCPSNEITDKVLNERRLRMLSELAARAYLEKTVDGAAKSAAATLAKNPDDIPFALLYLEDRGRAVLKETAGVDAGVADVSPREVDPARPGPWPIAEVLASAEARLVPLPESAALPRGPGGQKVPQALVLPLSAAGQDRPAGVLVAGVSPARRLDREYRSFFDLVAGQVGTAVRSATVAEEERRRVHALAELDRAKTLFFSNVSHEFRTPLTLLLGPVEDALRGPQGALTGESLEAVHRNALRLLKLVNTLLDFSRIEAGRIQAAYERVDLPKLTAELASVFRSAIERAGLELVVDCPPLPDEAYVDPALWEKIVLNLLSNALKFTFEGRIEVKLRAEGGTLVLDVADSGTGIPESELPRLFDRFHRVQGARARSYEGSGIGLALVHELVKLHGGRLSAESRLGKGSRFRVELPAGRAHLPASQIVAGATPPLSPLAAAPFLEEALAWTPPGGPASPAPAKKPARILLADDNADMRAYLERLLKDRWGVESAADGVEALERALAHPPDLILSDVMMPRLDGFGLLKALRADARTRMIPVIFLSARAGEESRIEGLDWGADDYLIKPFSSQELIARVSSHLKLSRLREHSQELVRSALGAARMFAWELNMESGEAHVSEGLSPVIGAPSDFPEARAWENVHPEDEPAMRLEIARAVAEAASFTHRMRYRRFDTGEWIWLEVRGQGIRGADGKVRRVAGLAMDVSDRVRVEADLHARREEMVALMESTPAFIWVAQDPEGRLILGNRSADQLLRLRPGENVSMVPGGAAVAPPFRLYEGGREIASEEAPIPRALREGRELRNCEERLVFEDGSFVDLLGNVVPLRNPDGSVRGAVGAFVDVTKLKAVEAEIRAFNASLEEKIRVRTARMSEALHELETFAYSVAHDLRGPLRAMNQFSDMLIEEYAPRLGPEGQEYARRIGEAAERMDHLTRDLLEYSRLARTEVAIEPILLRPLVQEILASLDADLKQSGAHVDLEVSDETALGNRFLLTQALTNLIGNALKFTKPGQSPELRIRCGPAGAAGRVRLWIEDQGIGIDPAHHQKLFRLFERLDPQGPYKGTGIGLAIARKAVERMGGGIGVESERDRGSRFYLELPAGTLP